MIVITDGQGNTPASPLSGGRSVTDLDFPANEWVYDIDDCGSCGGCNSACRAARHDDWMCVAYRQKWNTTMPTVYAVGTCRPTLLGEFSKRGMKGVLTRNPQEYRQILLPQPPAVVGGPIVAP